jgi:predicted O-methyltransferase YrrM
MMGFLQDNWERIKPDKEEGVDVDFVNAVGFLRPWNHDVANMRSICEGLKILRPRTVIELGTFEGMGTMKMAKALQETKRKVDFYTIDVGDAPVNSLGLKYGNPLKYDDDNKVIPERVPWEEFKAGKGTADQIKSWGSWGWVMSARDKRLLEDYGDVNLEFIQGFSFDVLPDLLKKVGTWDFCFQDTLHGINEIKTEWVLLKPTSKVGSIIVFDDINRNYNRGWADWFHANEFDWETRWSEFGHEPLWAERIR